MNPDIYESTDVHVWLCTWVASQPEGNTATLRSWLGEQLGIGVVQVRALLDGKRYLTLEHVDVLARITGLDAEGREYLRRLIVLQRATTREHMAAQLSVWEIYAAKQGAAQAEVARLLARPVTGPVEAAFLPALPLLAELPGAEISTACLSDLLLLPPEPSGLERVVEDWRAGARFGDPDGTRFCAMPGPGLGRGQGAEVWEGCFTLARHSLLSVRAEDRDYHPIIWAVDQEAVDAANTALLRLGKALRVIVRRHAEARPGRVLMLLAENFRVSKVLRAPDAEYRPGLVSDPAPLRAQRKRATKGQDSQNGAKLDGSEPCLYRHLDFRTFAKTWVAHRGDRGRVNSATWLARQTGLSRTLSNDLCTGAAHLQFDHIPGVIAAFQLQESDAAYLEGLVRYRTAKSPLARARERTLLLGYAADRGVRTPQGEHFRFSAHWAPPALNELFSLPGAWTDRAWAHFALEGRVPLDEAADYLETLFELGLLDRETGQPRSSAVFQEPDLAIQAKLAAYSLQDSLLDLLRSELLLPVPDRTLLGWVFTIPEAAWPLVLERVAAYSAEVLRLYQAASQRKCPDRVVITATHLFPLVRMGAP